MVRFFDTKELMQFIDNGFDCKKLSANEVEVYVSGHIDDFIKQLSKYKVQSIDIKKQSLEEVFMTYYKGSVEG